MEPEEVIAKNIAEFVLNHKRNIEDGVADFGLLLEMLKVIEDSIDDK